MLTELQSHNEEITASERDFRLLAESFGAVFWLTDVSSAKVVYVSPAYEKVWGRTRESLYVSPEEWTEAIHAEDRQHVLSNLSARRSDGTHVEEYRVVRPDGTVRWIRDRSFPIHDETGEVYRIAGIAEDITEHKQLEQEIIETSDRELSRLGQDLHDGICQQLVSIAFAADLVRRDLVAKSPSEAARVARITALLDNAITQARNLSHTLCPVSLAGNGLGLALRELAVSISRGYQVTCEVDCPDTIFLRDHAVATHLYRITQEALQHAVKHANASRVSVNVRIEGSVLRLGIKDNGLESNPGGFANVMHYRANMAGGTLEVQRNPQGGTTVVCSCPVR